MNIIGFGDIVPDGFSLDCNSKKQQVDLSSIKNILKTKKMLKFMSKQDQLSLLACDRALKTVKGPWDNHCDDIGIYLCTGILPFEDGPLDQIAKKSMNTKGMFDMELFQTDAYESMNPLLTFKCLPNMPLFHISYHLGAQGRYLMTYPGVFDWFQALNVAIDDLNCGDVTVAIVGVVCDQSNFLVQNHLKRLDKNLFQRSIDCGSFIILSKEESFQSYGKLENIRCDYLPFDPTQEKEKLLINDNRLKDYAGAASASLCMTQNLKLNKSFSYKLGLKPNNTLSYDVRST